MVKKFFFEKNRDINDVLSSSKLVIFTYLATPFFQSLSSLNIPTIIYFDYKKFDISKENIMLFEKLKQLNLLFDDFNKLLRFLANNSDNIEQWWQKIKNSNDLKKFCRFHCHSHKDDYITLVKLTNKSR